MQRLKSFFPDPAGDDAFSRGHWGKLALFSFAFFWLNVLGLKWLAGIDYPSFARLAGIEDGPVETLTAVFMFLAALLLLLTAARGQGRFLRGACLLGGLAFLFAGGEEISWGQRIFGFATPDFLGNLNAAGETNLHNIPAADRLVGGFHEVYRHGGIALAALGAAAYVGRKAAWSGLPLPSLPLLLAFLIIAAEAGDNQLLRYLPFNQTGAILLFFLAWGGWSRDFRLLTAAGATLVCLLILAPLSRYMPAYYHSFYEAREYLSGLAGLLYALQIAGADPAAGRLSAIGSGVKAGWRQLTRRRFSIPGIRRPSYAGGYRNWLAVSLLLVALSSGLPLLYGQGAAANLDYYADLPAQAEPAARSGFYTLYRVDGQWHYLGNGACPRGYNRTRFNPRIYPEEVSHLRLERRSWGFDLYDFRFDTHLVALGAALSDLCALAVPLPEYPIESILTGQYFPGEEWLWQAEIGQGGTEYRAAYKAARAGEWGPPAAQSVFDLYLGENRLAYVKEPCAAAEVVEPFRLHFIPVDTGDLREERREYGFDSYDFSFGGRGQAFDGKCVALVPLPNYPLTAVRTGQFGAGGRAVWEVEFGADDYRSAAAAIQAGEWGTPAAQADFDLYLRENRLAYVKEPCAAADVADGFLLHFVPVDTADLPAERRPYGFSSNDFRFDWRGRVFDGKCVAIAALPDYPLAAIRTGQYRADGGKTWEVEIAVGR